jgi:beta-glucanase (GH16 family)
VDSGRPGVDVTSCGDTRPDPDQRGDRILRVFPQPFATCRITSTGAFGGDGRTYKLSARVKVPRSRGHYTSFWTNSRSGAYNEIDVFESYGHFTPGKSLKCGGGEVARNTRRFRGMQSMVYLGDAPKTGRAHCWTPRQLDALRPFDGRWHTYTAVWNPGDSVTFSIDGRRVARFGPRYAVSTQIDLRLTDIDNNDSEKNSESLKVDWVKVWRR